MGLSDRKEEEMTLVYSVFGRIHLWFGDIFYISHHHVYAGVDKLDNEMVMSSGLPKISSMHHGRGVRGGVGGRDVSQKSLQINLVKRSPGLGSGNESTSVCWGTCLYSL